MAAFGNVKVMRRRGLITLSVMAAVAAIAVGVMLWQAVQLSSLAAVSTRVNEATRWVTALRLALIATIALLWPRLAFLSTPANADTEIARARWMAIRWRVVGWLLAIELVIGQNLLMQFLTALVCPG